MPLTRDWIIKYLCGMKHNSIANEIDNQQFILKEETYYKINNTPKMSIQDEDHTEQQNSMTQLGRQ